jgi:PAS domain S-box-containing protein
VSSTDFNAFDRLGGFVVFLNADDTITHCNRAFSGIVEFEVRGTPMRDLVSESDRTRLSAWLASIRTDGRPRTFEHVWSHGGHEERTIAWRGAIVEVDDDASGPGLLLDGVDVTDSRVAQKERRRWQERLEAVTNLATDAIILIDEEQRIIMYNEGAESTFGWSRQEALGQPVGFLIPKRFRAVHRGHVSRFATDEVVSRRVDERHAEVVGLRKTGEEFPAEAAICRLDLGAEKIFSVVLRDVTARRRREESLRLSEERLRVALQGSPAVVFNQDLELRYTWIHGPRLPLMAQDVLGRTDFDLFPRAEAESLTAVKRRVLGSGVGTREVVRATIEGRAYHYDLTIEPLRSTEGTIVGITCASWDVSDQVRMQSEQEFLAQVGKVLMTASLDYAATLAQIAEWAVRHLADWFLIDIVESGRVRRLKVACSDPGKRTQAKEVEALQLDRRRPHLMFEPLEHRRSVLKTDVTSEYLEAIAQSVEHLRSLRALRIRSLIAVPLIAHDRLLGAIAMISSHTSYDRRDLAFVEEFARLAAFAVENAHLYQSAQRAIDARDEVLGIVAHDLRTPLNTILMQAELLKNVGGAVPPRLRPADVVRRAAKRMDRLIQDMLDVARLEAGPLAVRSSTLDPRVVLDDAIEATRANAASAGIEIRPRLQERLPDIVGDRDRLEQALANLIGNAIKFSSPGGEVVVGAELGDDDVIFWVADTGRGIAKEHLRHLFDPFWQGDKDDRRGAGLGLPIVKGIVEAHQGRVWIASELGRGTTVYFSIPIRSASTHPQPTT